MNISGVPVNAHVAIEYDERPSGLDKCIVNQPSANRHMLPWLLAAFPYYMLQG